MKGGKYAKTRQDLGQRNTSYTRYRKTFGRLSEEMFYRNLSIFVRRRRAGAHLDGHQHDGRKPAETSFTELCYKSVKYSSRNSQTL